MKIINVKLYILVLFSALLYPQSDNTLENVFSKDKVIYSIRFYDSQNGSAVSEDGINFYTTDGGINWTIFDNRSISSSGQGKNSIYWSADICLHTLHTTNAGLTWLTYSGEQQKHFIQAYLRDENTEYKIAINFLQSVSNNILTEINNSEKTTDFGPSKNFTEYYTNENEGWVLGWYLKNFILKK